MYNLQSNISIISMANVHGFNDVNQNNRNNRNNRRANPNGLMQPILPGEQDPAVAEELRNNRVPFLNTMQSDRPPLDETIPYTLKIVWCPTLKLLSITIPFCAAIWALYIMSLTQGIAVDVQYGVLAPEPSTLRDWGAISYQLVKDGEVWRLIAAGFLHVNLSHIVMNTASLLFLLTRIEVIYNPVIIILFMLASLVGGNIMSVTVNSRTTMSVGASTIIEGIFGGLIAYMIINWQTLGAIRSQLCCIIGIIVFFSTIFSLGDKVDFAGHMGGLLCGLLCGLAIFPGIKQKNKYIALGGGAALAAYFLVMFLVFFLTD